jgi:diguanylate cyclase (GGDEF)-like protein
MRLDVNTLFIVTIHVEAILGLLLLFAWVQNPGIRALAWWGCAHLMRAASVVLFGLYGSVSVAVSIDLANTVLFLAYAVTWTGARVFDGRKPLPLYIVMGLVVWCVVSHLPTAFDPVDLRLMLASGIVAAYTWLTAYEFWRGRGEPLVSRWPAIFMLVAHGSLFLLRSPLAGLLPWLPADQALDSVWLTVLSFEALLFTIAIAFILLAMAKERTEYRHRTAARLAKRHAASSTPTAVLLIDLDHFKSINDRFGHAVGDRVLQIFAVSTMGVIRKSDLLGRLGGEEFAAVLYNVNGEKALALAEQIRSAFAEATLEVDGSPVGATLSIGVVLHQGAPLDVSELLLQADQALYYAKERGRNRVEFAHFDLARRRSDAEVPDLAMAKTAA